MTSSTREDLYLRARTAKRLSSCELQRLEAIADHHTRVANSAFDLKKILDLIRSYPNVEAAKEAIAVAKIIAEGIEKSHVECFGVSMTAERTGTAKDALDYLKSLKADV